MMPLKDYSYDLNRIEKSLNPLGFHLIHFKTLDSSNSYLKNHPELDDFTFIIADEQSAGRGRQDRSFESKKDLGIYTSILIRQKYDAQNIAWLSLMTGVSIALVLQKYSDQKIRLKWPNDVLLNDKKVAGILLENMVDGRIIIGFGINIYPQTFNDKLEDIATSLFHHQPLDKSQILIEIYLEIKKILDLPFSQQNQTIYQSLLHQQKNVVVEHLNHRYSAKIIGVSDLGLLMVEDAEGKIHHLASEDIHLVSK